jgi:NAD(P)-dependent dehydrogenase (short-subunit alcohol dehydrogenase family)
MTDRLTNKVAIITGGSRGIGAAMAESFVQEGARVVLTARKAHELDATVSRLEGAHAGRVFGRVCHNGDLQQLGELVAWAEEHVGVVDVLVNNAGTNPYFGPMIDTEWGAWDKTFEVNLKGSFELSRLVARRLMHHGRGGSIINVSSILGQGAAPLQGVYGMTKAAMISMTQTLAFEWGRQGIRVNAIAPGVVETKLAAVLTGSPEMMDLYTQRTCLGRHGQPREIAGAAVYLASDESSYLTGHTLNLDGGYKVG